MTSFLSLSLEGKHMILSQSLHLVQKVNQIRYINLPNVYLLCSMLKKENNEA